MNMSVVIELENTWLEVLKTKLSIMGFLRLVFLAFSLCGLSGGSCVQLFEEL